ncbi:MAG: cofactor-independent phosphoglycerate mutase [Clostridiales Family XIII bacterium]|jgi:2,3-bisphosphoglycerate-independent phosphoglycerate mutase|nr:cofactor-independent phosphoglycerate mutase [Clostridiales Family XIII bacterium]
MKYLILVPDGAADRKDGPLGDKTPLEIAHMPQTDYLAQHGEIGLVQTIPEGIKPGSDAANLAVMGYDPVTDLTGRSPLEAVSMGIEMADTDVAFRTNLVTLSREEDVPYDGLRITDHSAGDISNEEGRSLIEFIDEKLGAGDPRNNGRVHFYPGISYRHALIVNEGKTTATGIGDVYSQYEGYDLTPPHDILTRRIGDYLPVGEGSGFIGALMRESYELLKNHPINISRRVQGLHTADSIWIWGEGKRPQLKSFEEKYGIKGRVISAVDLIKGIGICAGLDSVDVEGATGTIKTNFEGKAEAVIAAFREGKDFVYVHVEAPDECGHQGDAEGKVQSLEYTDTRLLKPVLKYLKENLQENGEDYRILIVPDHRTPLSIRTHSSEPVPFVIYDSRRDSGTPDTSKAFTEAAGGLGRSFASGQQLADYFFNGENV